MLYEAVDAMDSSDLEYKEILATKSPILTWAEFISYDELKKIL